MKTLSATTSRNRMAAFGTRDYLNLQCDGTEQWVYGVGGEACFQATLKVKAFPDLELLKLVGKLQSNTDEATFKSECCLSHILDEFILCMS